MKAGTTVGLALVLLAAATNGCVSWNREAQEDRAANTARAEAPFKEAAANGIVAQRVVYPHHFVAGTAELTGLGKQRLDILAEHYRQHPGALSVRRMSDPMPLYNSRVETVKAFLAERGVDIELMAFEDAYPGGDGMASWQVYATMYEIIEEKKGTSDGDSDGSSRGMQEPRRARAGGTSQESR